MANPDVSAPMPVPDVDYRLAFELAPLGLALSRQRTMVDCNQALCEMFGASREQLVGQSFEILYPTSTSAPAPASSPSLAARATTPTTES
jgi:PAS domain-containing protein